MSRRSGTGRAGKAWRVAAAQSAGWASGRGQSVEPDGRKRVSVKKGEEMACPESTERALRDPRLHEGRFLGAG